jgi:subtilisin family serine protease
VNPLRWSRNLLLALVVPSIAAASTPAAFQYHYFDEPVALRLDEARIAFSGADLDLGAIDADLRTIGIRTETVTASGVRSWYTAELESGRDGTAMTATARRLESVPGIEFATPVFADDFGMPLWVTPYVLVRFVDAVSPTQARATMVDAGFAEHDVVAWGGMSGSYRAKTTGLDGAGVLDVANELARRPDTRYAEPEVIFSGRSDHFPNDPGFSNCWGLHNTGQVGGVADMDMDAPEAWDVTFGSNVAVVVVIDTGVQQNHPDITQVAGVDLTGEGGGGGPVNACDNHGTAVAGCVSGTIDNLAGTVGVAPNTPVASARTFVSNLSCDGSWTSNSSWTVDALTFAEGIGARVTNNSNGYGFTSSTIASKYAQTRANGLVHFASAGNNSSSVITYPSSLPDVNAVAALTRTGARASFSNFGNGIAFSAPGAQIYSTDRTGASGYGSGDYAFVSGTSFASPYTAGVASLVLSLSPGLTAAEVEAVLASTCMDLGAPGYDTNFGWGFVNAFNAVLAIGAVDAPVVNGTSIAALGRSAPNPFTSATTFSYQLPQDGRVEVAILDVAGRVVRSLDVGPRRAGSHEITWDGRDARGSLVASGVYFYRLRTPQGETARRVVRVR